jgi:uncharacterized protein YecE (DUF72 family)
VHVGTSGWIYKEWGGGLYPDDVPASRHLEFYAERLSSVEINATFYRLPPIDAVKAWRARVPAGFVFAVKGSRFITHMKRLAVEKASIAVFFGRARLLKDKCGPILWQLPPNFQVDLDRLDGFLRMLPRRFRHAVEFRHLSWYDEPRTLEVLHRRGAALVWLSALAMPPVPKVTGDFVYMRFHGLEGGAAHDYTRGELRPWASACAEATKAGLDVFAYFNNDANTRARAMPFCFAR